MSLDAGIEPRTVAILLVEGICQQGLRVPLHLPAQRLHRLYTQAGRGARQMSIFRDPHVFYHISNAIRVKNPKLLLVLLDQTLKRSFMTL